jgi:hypothetical protein
MEEQGSGLRHGCIPAPWPVSLATSEPPLARRRTGRCCARIIADAVPDTSIHQPRGSPVVVCVCAVARHRRTAMVTRHFVRSSDVSLSRNHRSQRAGRARIERCDQAFQCVQCRQYVVCDPGVAGVQHRNHCPACLWSRHLDWRTAGDRLAGCRAAMAPVGLTSKRSRNKYARERDGELMLIHQCISCATIVIIRSNADDSPAAILELVSSSQTISPRLEAELADQGIARLTTSDTDLVRKRLFGKPSADAQQATEASSSSRSFRSHGSAATRFDGSQTTAP